MTTTVDMPLSDEDFDLLEERGLDVHHALGVIHAVGVAPGMIPTPQWLPLAFGNVPPDQTTIGLVLRLYNEVLGMLSKGREVMIPEATDEDACIAFASGYVAAATLDPAWVGHTARWTFAAPLAFLAERHDLVPAGLPRSRRMTLSAARATTARVGRNEPCPCGSGKKYKRCCLERTS